jgi:hypothetical protein
VQTPTSGVCGLAEVDTRLAQQFVIGQEPQQHGVVALEVFAPEMEADYLVGLEIDDGDPESECDADERRQCLGMLKSVGLGTGPYPNLARVPAAIN